MPIMGIDISTLNGDINFLAVKKAGVGFAMVKASQGHALYSKGYLFEDKRFARNILGLHKVGIPVGAYHFFTASNLEETYKEADFFIKTVEPYRDKITLYLACDAEVYGNPYINKLSRAELTRLIDAFCKRVESAGFHACHYTNTDHINNYINLYSLDFPVWHAHYSNGKGTSRPTKAGKLLAMHQYSDNGQLPGVVGQFDMNFGYGPLARLIIKSRTTLEDQTLDYIDLFPSGEMILSSIADKLVKRGFAPLKSISHEKLVSYVRLHCNLTHEEAAYLNSYKYAGPLFEKLYYAMISAPKA